MNVTEKGLKEYLETFYETLHDSSQNFLPPKHQKNLRHLSLLPAKIIGYVSTQYGVAVEYIPSDQTIIKTIRGSGPIEDLIVQAPKKLRSIGPIFRIRAANIGSVTGMVGN